MEIKMDYGPADRWVKEQMTSWSALARLAGVKPPALSARKTRGSSLPSSWIAVWARHFRLTPDEVTRLFLTPVRSEAELAEDERARQRDALIQEALEQGGEFARFMREKHPEILAHFLSKWIDQAVEGEEHDRH